VTRTTHVVLIASWLFEATLLGADEPPPATIEKVVAHGFLQLKYPGSVSAVAFSPDGRLLAAGGTDNTVHIWSEGKPELDRKLLGHQKEVLDVAFSPDGKLLATGSLDHRVRVFDVAEARVIHTLSTHAKGVHAVVFSPDGKMLVSGGADLTLNFWDPQEGKRLIHVKVPLGHVVPFLRDDRGRFYRQVTRPDGTRQKVLARGFGCLAFSPDGKTLSATQDVAWGWGWVVINVPERTGQIQALGGARVLGPLLYSPDGSVFVWTYAGSNQLIARTVETGKDVFSTELPKAPVRRLHYSADSKTLFVLTGQSKEYSVYFVDATNGRPQRVIDCPPNVITSFDVSSDGRYLAAGSKGAVFFWVLKPGESRSGAT